MFFARIAAGGPGLPRHPIRNVSVAASRPRGRKRYYWIGAALGAFALASPLVIAAAPAAAQGFDFSSVSGDGSGDLAITVSSDYQLTDWTLSLANGTSTYTMDDFTDFTDQDTFVADTPQTYVLPTADAQSVFGSAGIALPPGDYTVTATAATDSNGDTLASPQTITTGTFNFVAQPVLAFSGPTFGSTEPNQSVAVSGQITCSTVACPSSWTGTSVTVTDVTASAKPQWTTTSTDSDGAFSVSVTGVPGDNYSASVPAVTGTSLAATTSSTTQDVPQYAQTSITATATAAAYGTQSITGQLTFQPQSGGFNQDAPAGVAITATGGGHTVSTTTGSNGDFSLALPPLLGNTTWLISSEQDDLESTPFLAATEYSVSANQLWPVTISFGASLDKYGDITVEGCMTTTIKERAPADSPTMSFQWRKRNTGPWLSLGSLSTTSREGCSGFGFYGSHSAPAASAYYRAYFPGDDVYAPAYSASTGRLWKYPTQFNPFRASSHSVAAGHKVTISGTLQYQKGNKWRGYGYQAVYIIFSATGTGSLWYLPDGGTVKTNRKGAFSWTFTDTYGSKYWSANYQGNNTHFVSSAPVIRIRVRGSASSKPVSSGQPLSVLSTAVGARDSVWSFVLSADPWLVLMAG